MNMRLLTFLILILALTSCNTGEKSNKSSEDGPPQRAELSKDSKVFLGNRLFSEKTCITCHDIDSFKKAPSVVDIVRAYKGNNADIEAFLRGQSKPIVDTTESQVAIM